MASLHLLMRLLGYLKYLQHATALCDRCMTRLSGLWFRCAYCAMDLCETCQEVDTHNDNHAFIVFKSLVRGFSMIHCVPALNMHDFVD